MNFVHTSRDYSLQVLSKLFQLCFTKLLSLVVKHSNKFGVSLAYSQHCGRVGHRHFYLEALNESLGLLLLFPESVQAVCVVPFLAMLVVVETLFSSLIVYRSFYPYTLDLYSASSRSIITFVAQKVTKTPGT